MMTLHCAGKNGQIKYSQFLEAEVFNTVAEHNYKYAPLDLIVRWDRKDIEFLLGVLLTAFSDSWKGVSSSTRL